MRILFFGTYDERTHPRVRVLREGMRGRGHEVIECNRQLGLSTAERVKLLQQPWKLPILVLRMIRAWWSLWRGSRQLGRPDAVVVGYLGHFDVHLARWLWPQTPIALDHLVSGADTASDRGVRNQLALRALRAVDEAAVRKADAPFVDTAENLELLSDGVRDRAIVVAVGAPSGWFRRPTHNFADPLEVIFFGLYTPLQGTLHVGEAIRYLTDHAGIRFTMVGHGQDRERSQQVASTNDRVAWVDWIAADRLSDVVAAHDVCLGIFGTGPKARRVVPNKVYQGAAAGCAIVTSDTVPQRTALNDAAVFVRPGDGRELASALRSLAEDRQRLAELRERSSAHAERTFGPAVVVDPLIDRMLELVKDHR